MQLFKAEKYGFVLLSRLYSVPGVPPRCTGGDALALPLSIIVDEAGARHTLLNSDIWPQMHLLGIVGIKSQPTYV